jgi:hypothetical protein
MLVQLVDRLGQGFRAVDREGRQRFSPALTR